MQTTAENLNSQRQRDDDLNLAAFAHGLVIGILLALGGVNYWVAGAATGFTFIVVKLLLSIRDRLPDSD